MFFIMISTILYNKQELLLQMDLLGTVKPYISLNRIGQTLIITLPCKVNV